MTGTTTALRRLLAEESFIHLPVAYDGLGGPLIEQTGFKAAYVGGFVTDRSRCTSEPQLTLDKQVASSSMPASPVSVSRTSCSPSGRTITNTWHT
jgi:2-methylisocitrate lyase-like PEP mutase family enzyme